MPEFYMIFFAGKNYKIPEFYISDRKIFFPIFFWGGRRGHVPFASPPSPTHMAAAQNGFYAYVRPERSHLEPVLKYL